MDRFKSLQAFVEVARQENFAAAARRLEWSTSVVSRAVMDLENWLGMQLFNRTTRRVSLTAAGQAQLLKCTELVNEISQLKHSAEVLRDVPEGLIRISAPVFIGKNFLGPKLPAFLSQYPGVRIRLHLIDRKVNLIEEGFDLVLRIGELADSTLIARKLAEVRLLVTASPAYLEKRGTPLNAADLSAHNCLVDLVLEHGDRWPLKFNSKTPTTRVSGNLSVNDGELIRDLTLEGVGISLLPDFFVGERVESGELISLLDGQLDARFGIYLVYPQTRHLASTVRLLIDHLSIGEPA